MAKPIASVYSVGAGAAGPSGVETLRFLIVGNTGSGKSALGNSMLAWGLLMLGEMWTTLTRPFKSRKAPGSTTINCNTKAAEVLGRTISIVDTPGFFDTRHEDHDKTIDELTKCVMMVAPGPHAILLVVKMEVITKEVIDGIELMKKKFGKESINFLIIVFTHIDSLEEGESLEEFEDEMTGKSRELVVECENRYIGFNNKFEPTSVENRDQVEQLLLMAEEIKRKNGVECYTQEFFEEAQRIMEAEKNPIKAFFSRSDIAAAVTKVKGCFASDSTVRVQTPQGRIISKSLEDLLVGDLVESYDPKGNSVTYSPVYYITYQDDNESMSSLQELFYQGNDGKELSIRLQAKYLVYATVSSSASLDTESPPSTPIMSQQVNVGDVMWVVDDDTGALCPRRVVRVGEIVANIRHPMTMNYTIIVDGVLASVHMHNEWLLRQATIPLRLLYKISPSLSEFWLTKKAVQAWDHV